MVDLAPEPELDEAAIGRLRAGDPSALTELFRRHGARVWRIARGMLGQVADADDATQEVFLRVRAKAASYAGRGPLRAWLRRLTIHHCINRLDERERRCRRLVDLPVEELGAEPRLALDTQEALARALERLPPPLRAVLVLREIDGLSYREIAQALDLPIGTVMSRLARARERLLGVPPAATPRAAKPARSTDHAVTGGGNGTVVHGSKTHGGIVDGRS